jgi:hypothetical protein
MLLETHLTANGNLIPLVKVTGPMIDLLLPPLPQLASNLFYRKKNMLGTCHYVRVLKIVDEEQCTNLKVLIFKYLLYTKIRLIGIEGMEESLFPSRAIQTGSAFLVLSGDLADH